MRATRGFFAGGLRAAGFPYTLALAILASLAVVAPVATEPSARVRGTSIKETALLADLLARSETARALIAAIESTDAIVYVELTGRVAAGRAATRFVAARDSHRYLRIVIGAMTHPADRGALLAHELQHVLEIGRAREVRDQNSMRRLYGRIGEDAHARFAFETTAAREVAFRVRRELAMKPTRSGTVASNRE